MSSRIPPNCIGFYGTPITPNGPCEKCGYGELCRHVKSNFIPRNRLEEILLLLQEAKKILRGVG